MVKEEVEEYQQPLQSEEQPTDWDLIEDSIEGFWNIQIVTENEK